jgi:hypothetical protein
MLKNADSFLPLLNSAGKTFAFIGPHANSTQKLMAAPGYHGTTTIVDRYSPLMVARRKGWHVVYERGCNICDVRPPHYPNQPCQIPSAAADTSGIASAQAAARAADIAVLFLGTDQTTEAEGFDRHSLKLPGAQEKLLQAVLNVSRRVVLVLINGGPIDISTAADNPSARAILEAFSPGELGGQAILDVLDGTSCPSGKMPYTSYYDNYTLMRDHREVDLRQGSGTTYWWMREPVLFPFGTCGTSPHLTLFPSDSHTTQLDCSLCRMGHGVYTLSVFVERSGSWHGIYENCGHPKFCGIHG